MAGGIPLIRALRESLAGERIHRVMGIVNGTTNYILTRMAAAGASYQDALSEAQSLGYAERDPTADVEGFDAAAKAAILANVAFGAKVVAGDVYREGISALSRQDFEAARRLGFAIRLLAVVEAGPDGSLGVRVHPAMVPQDHPLAAVRDSFNAVFVEGDAVGQLMLFGRGAGGLPTASAVLGDLVDAAHNLSVKGVARKMELHAVAISPIDDLRCAYYLSLFVADRPGVLSTISGVLGIMRFVRSNRRPEPKRPAPPQARRGRTGTRAGLSVFVDPPRLRERDTCKLPGGYATSSVRSAGCSRQLSSCLTWRGEQHHLPAGRQRHPHRRRYPADRRPPAVGSDRREGMAEARGGQPNGFVQGPGDDRGDLGSSGQGCQVYSTGNTSASAAAYAARAGLTCAVLIPDGYIALGKLAQALVHGARVVQVRGNFDRALELVRELAATEPVTVVNSINPYRIEGQKTGAFEIVDALGGAPDIHCIPVGNAGNITAYWKGYREYQDAGKVASLPRMFGFQAAGAAPIVLGHPVEKPETIATAIRIGNPASWYGATAAASESGGLIDAVDDDAILDAYRFLAREESVFCEPASAASVAGLLRWPWRPGRGHRPDRGTQGGRRRPRRGKGGAGPVRAAPGSLARWPLGDRVWSHAAHRQPGERTPGVALQRGFLAKGACRRYHELARLGQCTSRALIRSGNSRALSVVPGSANAGDQASSGLLLDAAWVLRPYFAVFRYSHHHRGSQ